MADKDLKSNRGGARQGAGRKPNEVKTVRRVFYILEETDEAIKAMAESERKKGKVIDKAIKKLLNSD